MHAWLPTFKALSQLPSTLRGSLDLRFEQIPVTNSILGSFTIFAICTSSFHNLGCRFLQVEKESWRNEVLARERKGGGRAGSNGGDGSRERKLPPANGSAHFAPLKEVTVPSSKCCLWFEEELEEDLRWVFGVSKILHTGVSEFQDIQLVESGPFGKVLLLDGKLQSAEADEFVYHESIVHPALLYHSDPRNVFIMGGGEGSTAREALKHQSVEKVVMCDIDREVVDFCKEHLTSNTKAFGSNRLDLVINDARAELESREELFDIIIGDLADPVDGGPCYRLYTQSFYEHILKPRLNTGGILVTQGGPAGILSHTEVYSSIYNTLRQTFKYVVPYTAHVPSYADTWGWVMASDHPIPKFSIEDTDNRIKQRLEGELRFLDGETLAATLALNKHVRRTLAEERHVYTEETARFIHGHGTSLKSHSSEKPQA